MKTNPAMMEQKMIKIGEQVVHFRMKGNGLPIVLFHASPSSSKMFEPLIEALSQWFLVIAPDTPGYGRSQPLQWKSSKILDYVHFFQKFLHQLGLQQFAIYGTATGAQIGIRYGLEFPKEVQHLFLDNTAHFTEGQRSRILETYFPDLTPQLDGSHLAKIWQIVSQMFQYFPWNQTDAAHRLNLPPMPAAVLHPFAKDFIQSGKNYDRAYRAAFEHERAEYVQVLKVKTSLFDWKGSIIRPYTEQLLAHDLPSNIAIIETPLDRNERQKTMVEHIQKAHQSGEKINSSDIAKHCIGVEKKPSTILQKTTLPKVKPDLKGLYLQEAWEMILQQNENLMAEEAHEVLKDWLRNGVF